MVRIKGKKGKTDKGISGGQVKDTGDRELYIGKAKRKLGHVSRYISII